MKTSALVFGRRLLQTACGVALVVASASAWSFQVLPKVSDVDRKLAKLGTSRVFDPVGQLAITSALPMLKGPVHEAITLAALGCTTETVEDCVALDAIETHRILLYGVRWPDDPPFALDRNNPPQTKSCNAFVTLRSTAQPSCWLDLFNSAGAMAKTRLQKKPGHPAFGPGDFLLLRSHYGDLQFFHSMAAYDGEPAAVTRMRMKAWAQFLWAIATRAAPTDKFIRTMDFDEIAPLFPGEMTVGNLLSTGIVGVRKNLDTVALGALLHMVQDSFSAAHTERGPESTGQCPQNPRFAQPGPIAQFYSYAGQAGHKHDVQDKFDALNLQILEFSPTVIDVSRSFIDLWNEKVPWSEVGPYFDCVFELQNPMREAGPGPFLEDVKRVQQRFEGGSQ